MTDYLNKSFSVYPGAVGTQQYRDNYDRTFGKKDGHMITRADKGGATVLDAKKDEPQEEPVPDTEKEEYVDGNAAKGVVRVIPRESCNNPCWCGVACGCD